MSTAIAPPKGRCPIGGRRLDGDPGGKGENKGVCSWKVIPILAGYDALSAADALAGVEEDGLLLSIVQAGCGKGRFTRHGIRPPPG